MPKPPTIENDLGLSGHPRELKMLYRDGNFKIFFREILEGGISEKEFSYSLTDKWGGNEICSASIHDGQQLKSLIKLILKEVSKRA